MIGVVFGLAASSISLALGAAGIFTAPAFGFIGVSFPRLAMHGFATFWSVLMPLTWYMDLRVDQMLRGVPVDISLASLGALGWSALAYAVLAALLLVIRRPRDASREMKEASV
jgi:ABC-2 type transport system permease protein